MNTLNRSIVVMAALAGLASQGCATGPRDVRVASRDAGYGVVQSIETVPEGDGSALAGTLIGGAVGAVVGHQIGEGKGKDVATAAGAVGGAVAGHEIQKNQQRKQSAGRYLVHVRMPDGESRTYARENVSGLQVGERVRVDSNQIYP